MFTLYLWELIHWSDFCDIFVVLSCLFASQGHLESTILAHMNLGILVNSNKSGKQEIMVLSWKDVSPFGLRRSDSSRFVKKLIDRIWLTIFGRPVTVNPMLRLQSGCIAWWCCYKRHNTVILCRYRMFWQIMTKFLISPSRFYHSYMKLNFTQYQLTFWSAQSLDLSDFNFT